MGQFMGQVLWRFERRRIAEKVVTWIAWRLPRSVAYWAYVRVATEGANEYPGDQKVYEPMQRWRAPR